MPEYEHTQSGTLMRLVFGSGVLITGGPAAWIAVNNPAAAQYLEGRLQGIWDEQASAH